ncbi:MAG: hypothetical protein K1X57_22360, partial [Gemmataceae bacterium]|nr:hypothetical protein [Gemmataceae bacterium]
MAVHRPHSSAPRLHDPRTGSPRRRGNSLILVTAILVLLVIVAAAFLSRTQSGRQVSSAQQQSVQRGERVEPIANMVTDLVTDALFPQPLDPNAMLAGNLGTGHRVSAADSGMSTVTSSWPRLAIEPNAPLLGVDRDFNNDMVPDFAYN